MEDFNLAPAFKAAAGSFVGLVATTLSGVDPLLSTLIGLTILDVITGVMAAAKEGKISSWKSAIGMYKKGGMFGLVCAVAIFGHNIPGDWSGGLTKVMVGFFATTEFVSILENCIRLDVNLGPLAPWFAAHHAKNENAADKR